jgi:hypothetical protein
VESEQEVVTMAISTKAPSRLLVLLATMAVALLLLANAVAAGGDGGGSERYRVHPGDDLWGIASSIAEPGDDVRRLVFEIRSDNELTDAALVPGQVLLVPADS